MKTIRITGSGIFGNPTEDNPTGEYPIGYEFETASDLPAGWAGRAVIVGEEPKQGSEFVVNDNDDSDVGKARREVIEKAEAEFKRIRSSYDAQVQALEARANKAEADLQLANEQIEALNLKLKASEANDAATAEEIASAIALLDAKTDAHWTAAGLPAVDAVAELTGKAVTRKAIEEAAPDAKRPA
ncbi:hypothetical protein [Novosphingobium sp. B1]|uniref:hypothetical protein n=1 Tax=Novosphingobium sp. B1 TaxID=1938756 RepID=UPI0009D8C185|nr:hypothetical protein [Novosphingobium sp. B1]SMC97077.1 hypothetical protein SAMN06272759_11510 [Novosphingobium sp. B1]